MARKPLFRRRYPKKDAPEPVGLPTSIAWSTIAALILLGTIQELGRFGRPLDTRFGLTFICVFLAGTIISVSLFVSGRRRSGIAPPAKQAKKQARERPANCSLPPDLSTKSSQCLFALGGPLGFAPGHSGQSTLSIATKITTKKERPVLLGLATNHP